MKKIKNFRIQIFLLLAVMLCLAFIPGQLQAGGTDNSDKANNLFVYADDVNGKQVLLKVIPLSTLKTLMHGQDGTADSTYYGSFIDAYKTPTYCEGKGVTIPELLDYTFAQTSVANAGDLTYEGDDKLYFYSSDGPTSPANYKADELFADRYYFPKLYHYWDAEEGEISDVAAVLDEVYRMEMPPYLAVESRGGRVFANTGGDNISEYVEDNGGVVAGCLRNDLEDTESLRLVLPQTEEDIEESESTYNGVRKWVYKVRLREDGTSPITSLGTVSDPTCTFTLSEDILTITMNCADSDASIYYSTIDGHTKTPVNLYTGPITVEDYNKEQPFTLGVVAVREGYEDSAAIQANSANISDDPDDPSFVYALAADTEDIETGEAFTVAATLSADKDYTLYGAEYRMAIPTAAFNVSAVSSESGWEYGTATAGDDTIVTFTYLNTDGQAVEADTPLDIGSISLTPLQAGTATISVSEAIVDRADALPYSSVTAGNLTLTVEPASQTPGVWDGTADTSWYDAGSPLTAYTITTPEQLAGLASLVNAGNSFSGVTFTLANDLTLNSESSTANWTPIGTVSVTIDDNRHAVVGSGTPFAGIFDGAGYAVNGLYISSPDNMKGLFGYLTGTVKDLTVNGRVYSTAIAAGEYEKIGVGAVVAFNHGGII
ncbi:MAG: chitobiase/beta-hexosaminidase C-terminal domain-containing protein, partial [Dehalobacterium sp.]